jgi:adenylylsulfate reductase subunit A
LYAAGDVAGGCPQKYVTGALAEGEIAALDIVAKLSDTASQNLTTDKIVTERLAQKEKEILQDYETIRTEENPAFSLEELEEGMQKVMDEYAGGIGTNYQYNEKQLHLAQEKIDQLMKLAEHIGAADMHQLMFAYELKERLVVCKSLLVHLLSRKETRWHSFNENLDYPDTDETYFKYVNSKVVEGKLQVFLRELVGEDEYEHTN